MRSAPHSTGVSASVGSSLALHSHMFSSLEHAPFSLSHTVIVCRRPPIPDLDCCPDLHEGPFFFSKVDDSSSWVLSESLLLDLTACSGDRLIDAVRSAISPLFSCSSSDFKCARPDSPAILSSHGLPSCLSRRDLPGAVSWRDILSLSASLPRSPYASPRHC